MQMPFMKYLFIVVACCLLAVADGCSKHFLTTPPSSDIIAPSTLPQLAGLLNNDHLFGQTPVYGEQSADDYHLDDSLYQGLTALDLNLYTWQKDIYGSAGDIDDWNIPYSQVYTANVVLDKLGSLPPDASNQELWNRVKGQALFMRSHAFYQLAQVFAVAYDAKMTASAPGIVLPLAPLLHDVYARTTLQETYDRITGDLLQAKDLLSAGPADTARALPNRAAVCGLLARAYLTMGNYEAAGRWADSAIGYRPALTDYNSLSPADKFPFAGARDEVLYAGTLIAGNVVLAGRKVCLIDSALYSYYDNNDLRKYLYYKLSSSRQPLFKGSYSGNLFAFSGVATDEEYLIRAECNARKNKIPLCLADVNTLLAKRYKTGTYTPYTTASAEEALDLVLRERRKELVFRGLRWSDLKRLNSGGANIVLTRRLAGQAYVLTPNSNRYALPIPANALAGSAITQNPRD